MSESPPSTDDSSIESAKTRAALPGTLQCLGGAIVAGAIAYVLYSMTATIGHSFAAKPIQSDSYIVQRITAAVRTLIIGLSAMGTGIFGLAALGLFGLGIQVFIQRLKGQSAPPANS